MNTTEFLVDGTAFWARLASDIATARESVCVQTLTFEGDAAGRLLADALIASPAPRRRVLIDCFNLYFQSDCFVYAPWNMKSRSPVRLESHATSEMIAEMQRHGVEVQYTNPAGLMWRRMLARDHKKMVVVDDVVAYVGGINFCDHNFAWHDMMARIERPGVARTLACDFSATWEGLQAPSFVPCGEDSVLNFDGARNEATCSHVLELIDAAKSCIHVLSPYMTFPFTDALRRAVARGVHVIVVTPADNNRGFLRRYMLGEAARSGFDLRMYEGMSHLKGMLIDDAALVIGSSNFDWMTYYVQAEVVLVTTCMETIASFRAAILEPDLAMSVSAAAGVAWHATALELGMRAVAFAVRVLSKPALRPVVALSNAGVTPGMAQTALLRPASNVA